MHPPIVKLAALTPRRARRGVALVMFAMLVFVFLAIAGIAIDVGMASLTQQQMQVAADTASLEGIRLRDYEAYQDQSDDTRRPRVSQMVRLVFDDDLHPTGGVSQYGSLGPMPADDADQMRMGAGPMMSLSGGMGTYNASATWSVGGTNGVWDDPILQVNDGAPVHNLANGDMVSGTFAPDAPHTESASYVRPDFATNTNSERWKVLGFLVRMRRTDGSNALDQQLGIASHGPSMPLFFGLGSLLHKPDDQSGRDIRRDGINVRATAIAVARPALRASLPPRSLDGTPIFDEGTIQNIPMMGLYSISISEHAWTETFRTGAYHDLRALDVSTNGDLSYQNEIVGHFVAPATSVGQAIETVAPVGISQAQRTGYVAIHAPIAQPSGGSVDRVVGYGFAEVQPSATPNVVNLKLGIQSALVASVGEVTAWVAPNGVSAHLGSDAPSLSAAEWNAVFVANHTLAYGGPQNPTGAVSYDYTRLRPGTLLAPALAR
jgi:hypothetical protein